MGKQNINVHFTKADIMMTNKHMKIYTTSLAVKEIIS